MYVLTSSIHWFVVAIEREAFLHRRFAIFLNIEMLVLAVTESDLFAELCSCSRVSIRGIRESNIPGPRCRKQAYKYLGLSNNRDIESA